MNTMRIQIIEELGSGFFERIEYAIISSIEKKGIILIYDDDDD